MGKITGFKEYHRQTHSYNKITERIAHFNEFLEPLSSDEMKKQGARCMDCGIPFCHNGEGDHHINGCPLSNIIPDFNHNVYQGNYRSAFEKLSRTNNFPDITGRICPAPCESACVLGINKPPVAIKSIEYTIAEKGFAEGWFSDMVDRNLSHSLKQTGKKVAIIGSGPAGLACADQLIKVGHEIAVYERDDKIGGLLTYGIPNFKLEKNVVDRHVKRMEALGVKFITNTSVGKDISATEMIERYDAMVIAIGSTVPRDLPIPNRNTPGIHFAMDFLRQNTKRIFNTHYSEPDILATDKNVLVIGGGDTGSDCVGTSIRQGANSVVQIELLSQPPESRDETMPWPMYDHIFRTSSSQEEGCDRDFAILSKSFIVGNEGELDGVRAVKIKWKNAREFEEIKGSEFEIKANLILLAMGFLHPQPDGLLEELQLSKDSRGNVSANDTEYHTNVDKIFACGDARRGQSLVVWAMSEGRECAVKVDEYLQKKTSLLPSKYYSPLSIRQ